MSVVIRYFMVQLKRILCNFSSFVVVLTAAAIRPRGDEITDVNGGLVQACIN